MHVPMRCIIFALENSGYLSVPLFCILGTSLRACFFWSSGQLFLALFYSDGWLFSFAVVVFLLR